MRKPHIWRDFFVAVLSVYRRGDYEKRQIAMKRKMGGE